MASLRDHIERARRAQQENEQRHDVQLEILTDCDPGDEHNYDAELCKDAGIAPPPYPVRESEPQFFTGRTDGTVGPVSHRTMAEAEAWIEAQDAVSVAAGEFYIDAPDGWWNL
jgi:hypothetical protein